MKKNISRIMSLLLTLVMLMSVLPAGALASDLLIMSAPKHTVSVAETENGSVTVSKTSAAAGDPVNLVLKPDEGFVMKFVIVTDSKGAQVELLGSEDVFDFTMPASDVTVKAVFAESATLYSVTVEEAKNGKVTASTISAVDGVPVNLVIEADKGYVMEVLTVTDSKGNPVELLGSEDVFDFTMPASDVTVKVTFMEDNTMLNFFTDVFAGDYYYDAVLWAATTGVTAGTSATAFSPADPCTRAQVVTFLYRAVKNAGYDVSVGEDTNILSYNDAFDIPEYAIAAMQWACGAGVMDGYDNGNLGPNDICTRAQIVTFLHRTAQAIGVDVSSGEDTNILSYNDAFDIPGYAFPAMQWACAEDIYGGYGNGNLGPNDTCTRAQIVTFLYRFLNK